MHLKCLICSDRFTPNADIHTTPCGHLFHYLCLTQWIERSKTCPQCRSKTTEKSIHKIFLSIDEHGKDATNIDVLQLELESLQFELKCKEKDIKNSKEKLQTAKAQNVALREEIENLENKIRASESTLHALKEQTIYFKLKAKENTKLEEEIIKLREKINKMENVQSIITGSKEQVDEMLRQSHDVKSLSLLVSVLKKELIESDKKNKYTKMILKNTQNDTQAHKRELAQLNRQYLILQQEVEQHKNCETERQYLKKKIEELQNGSESQNNTSIKRILIESPAPFTRQTVKEGEVKHDTPLLEKVQQIKNSDSPYLQVQFSSVGLSGLMKYNDQGKSSNLKKLTLFKQASERQSDLKKPNVLASYDGLGGHAKHEEFPSPLVRTGIKRHRSTSTTSIKFRKLAPQPQKQLKSFFEKVTQ